MSHEAEIFKKFKSRLRARLLLAKMSIETAHTQIGEAKDFLEKFARGIFSRNEVQKFNETIDQLIKECSSPIDPFLTEIENLETATWQELFELQEKYLKIHALSHDLPSNIQNVLNEIYRQYAEKASKKLKIPSKAKRSIPSTPNPIEKYSTPSLTAMKAAIQRFWLEYDPKKPPAQKEISNFIADMLKEPSRNRMTDELARAIKPEGL